MSFEQLRQTCDVLAVQLEFPDIAMQTVSSVTKEIFGPLLTSWRTAVIPAVLSKENIATAESWVAAHTHPMAKKLPLMDPWDAAFTVVAYPIALMVFLCLGVIFQKLFGKLSYNVIAVPHNLFLTVLSLYMSFTIAVTVLAMGFSLWNNPVASPIHKGHEWRLAKLMWLFYASKIPEFIDTFIMALKQNYRQISFLHLYHHGSIFAIWFFVVSMAPGGDAYWSAALNSGVHVIMYGYYFGRSIFKKGFIFKFLNAIRFYITKLQMFQFFLNLVQTIYDLYYLPRDKLVYEPLLIHILFYYMLTLLALFANFLIKNNKGDGDGGEDSPSKRSSSPKNAAAAANNSPTAAQNNKKRETKKSA